MNEGREVWFVRREYAFQNYPVTWQGWLATILFGALVIVMVALAAVIASALFVVLMVALVIAVTIGFLRCVFVHSTRSRADRDDRRNFDA
ncbi:MAG: hypothetical protein K8S25_00290 [Alphaproteobacteria bacterium]|nr:hypothetical protein [Alphaproteobacteria bacterium]